MKTYNKLPAGFVRVTSGKILEGDIVQDERLRAKKRYEDAFGLIGRTVKEAAHPSGGGPWYAWRKSKPSLGPVAGSRKAKFNERLAVLLDHLADRPYWIPQRDIQAALGSDFDRDTVRHLANASKGQIISSQQGYKLLKDSEPAEVIDFTEALKQQRSALTKRIRETFKALKAA